MLTPYDVPEYSIQYIFFKKIGEKKYIILFDIMYNKCKLKFTFMYSRFHRSNNC